MLGSILGAEDQVVKVTEIFHLRRKLRWGEVSLCAESNGNSRAESSLAPQVS